MAVFPSRLVRKAAICSSECWNKTCGDVTGIAFARTAGITAERGTVTMSTTLILTSKQISEFSESSEKENGYVVSLSRHCLGSREIVST